MVKQLSGLLAHGVTIVLVNLILEVQVSSARRYQSAVEEPGRYTFDNFLDTNKDGRASPEEFLNLSKRFKPERFRSYTDSEFEDYVLNQFRTKDTNGNGFLTLQELNAP